MSETETEQTEKQTKPIIRNLNAEAKEKTPFEHHIAFEYTSEIDGKIYTGNFTYKKLTIGDISKIGTIKARLGGGFPDEALSDSAVAINNAIAHCTAWFQHMGELLPLWAKDFSKLYDAGVVYELHKEGLRFENNFRVAVEKRL